MKAAALGAQRRRTRVWILVTHPTANRELLSDPMLWHTTLHLFSHRQALLGKRISSFINVFKDAQMLCSNDTSLLTALGMRALEGTSENAWRVGVVQPKTFGQASDGTGIVGVGDL
jgi:hypothetical protein